MKRITLSVLIFALVFSSFRCEENDHGTGSVSPDFIQENWAQNKLWDDGLAEVATYEAERTIYGKVRKFEYVFVCVKEEFNNEYKVKTDDYSRNDLYTVLKVNKFCRIMTDNYPYHFMTSLFFLRESPAKLHKLTNSSQEWCGTTFQMLMESQKGFKYSYNSYWDGQGVGEKSVKEPEVWFEDQLSYSLRALNFKNGLEFKREVISSLVSSKASSLKAENGRFSVSEEGDLWKVDVNYQSGKSAAYWFRKEYPNLLVRQQTSDGRNLDLKSVERRAYWN